ncbi:MAG: hypothetical protein K2X51_11655 [Burkholderiales bacterium]|nr:hypothetical protein [Burkholderiales bacterium]
MKPRHITYPIIWQLSPLLGPLRERYPYQFAKPPSSNVEQSMQTGWLPAFAALCADVDLLLAGQPRGFYWGNLKEKMGSARWRPCFTHTLDAETREQLYVLVRAAEASTAGMCIACGTTSGLHEAPGSPPLCAVHLAQFRHDPQTFWDDVQP